MEIEMRRTRKSEKKKVFWQLIFSGREMKKTSLIQ